VAIVGDAASAAVIADRDLCGLPRRVTAPRRGRVSSSDGPARQERTTRAGRDRLGADRLRPRAHAGRAQQPPFLFWISTIGWDRRSSDRLHMGAFDERSKEINVGSSCRSDRGRCPPFLFLFLLFSFRSDLLGAENLVKRGQTPLLFKFLLAVPDRI
jgi:hypothetical protein